MATLGELCQNGDLVAIGGGLLSSEQPMRLLYASPAAIKWFGNVLPDLEPILDEGKQSPIEQVDELLHDYVSGADMSFWARSHSMLPTSDGVWELKTPDVRLFGWFAEPCKFVIAYADSAEKCKVYDLYLGHLGQTKRYRDQLQLNEPKFVLGDYAYVL